jgi:ABC-2 type transport system ATP-binding protein
MEPMLAVRAEGVVKRFGVVTALDGLALSVPAGVIYGLLGPNGSGKTTFIRTLTGALRPSAGLVEVLGRRQPSRQIAPHLGYMTQRAGLYPDLSVRENLDFFASIYGLQDTATRRRRINDVLAAVELTERHGSLVGTLSGGMQQRVSLAAALVHQPRLLLLDEPTAGIDPELRVTFWDHFRRLAAGGTTVLVSSHIMDEAERCDRLGFLRAGRLLAEGTPEDLRAQAGQATLEAAFLHFARGGTA